MLYLLWCNYTQVCHIKEMWHFLMYDGVLKYIIGKNFFS